MTTIDGPPGLTAPEKTAPLVLVVDDESGVCRAVERLLRSAGFRVLTAEGPTQALSLLRQHEVAVVVTDQMMPGVTGLELLALVRQNWPAVAGIMMTACSDIQVAADAVNRQLIHYFVTKPWDNATLVSLVRRAAEVHTGFQNGSGAASGGEASLRAYLNEQAGKAAFSLARAVDARDRYTHSHSERVSAFALEIGRAMGLDAGALEELRIGGLLHDVGKIGVPDEVLLKPGRLTEQEYQAIKLHPVIGSSIIEPIDFPWAIAAVVRQHHENHDGSGYPIGLSGDKIATAARIIHVVDAYEAMSANRVYRTARSADWIEAEFRRCRGTQFHPEAVDVFLQQWRAGRLT